MSLWGQLWWLVSSQGHLYLGMELWSLVPVEVVAQSLWWEGLWVVEVVALEDPLDQVVEVVVVVAAVEELEGASLEMAAPRLASPHLPLQAQVR